MIADVRALGECNLRPLDRVVVVVTDSVLADPLKDAAVLAPVERSRLQRMIRRMVVNRAPPALAVARIVDILEMSVQRESESWIVSSQSC